jgi:hypothetical protein
MDTSLSGKRVTKELDKLIAWRSAPPVVFPDECSKDLRASFHVVIYLMTNKVKIKIKK